MHNYMHPGLDPGNTVDDALTCSTPKLIILFVNLQILFMSITVASDILMLPQFI